MCCDIGIINISGGKWVNKDTIISNCEKCYKGNKTEITDCINLYKSTAESNLNSYFELGKKYRKELPGLVKKAKKEKYNSDILCFFKEDPIYKKNYQDTLNKVLLLNVNTIDDSDTYVLERYYDFLNDAIKRNNQYLRFQYLLKCQIPVFNNLKEVVLTMDQNNSILNFNPIIGNSKAEVFCSFFPYFSISRNCNEYQLFRQKIKENNVLRVSFYIMENLSRNSSFELPNVSPEVINASIDSIGSLDFNSLCILMQVNFLYEKTFGLIEQHIIERYNKIRLRENGTIVPADSIRMILRDQFTCNSFSKYILLIESFKRNLPITINMTKSHSITIENQAYNIIKEICP